MTKKFGPQPTVGSSVIPRDLELPALMTFHVIRPELRGECSSTVSRVDA